MIFGSIDEVTAYVKNAIASSTPQIADEMVSIAQQETGRQAQNGTWYQNTGAIVSCIQPTTVSSDIAEITWTDSGGWTSVFTNEHVYAPMVHEMGYTWGIGASNFVEASFSQIESEIPNLFVALLRSKGIPIS